MKKIKNKTLIIKISEHDLINKILDDIKPIIKKDIETNRKNCDNELEYYIWKFSRSILKLTSLCDRIHYNAVSLSKTPAQNIIKKYNIRKTTCLRDNIENYYIRLASLRDLIFITLDAAFNLHNSSRNCKYSIVSENLKVKQSGILKIVNDLYNLIKENIEQRNSILHEHEHSNRELDKIEALELFLQSDKCKAKNIPSYKNLKKTITTETVKKMKEDFLEINSKLYGELKIYFDKLEKIYQGEKTKLEKVCKND